MKKQISILNNFISGIGITILGFIILFLNSDLYEYVIYLLGIVLIIFGFSKLINSFFNKKVVRNRQLIISVLINAALGIFLLIFPKMSLILLPIVFSLYSLFNSLAKFINYLVLKEANLKSRFKDLFFSIFFLVISFICVLNPLSKINLIVKLVGIYSIMLGISILYGLIIDTLSYKTKLKAKRRLKFTLPIFFEAFVPKRAMKKINKYIDYLTSEGMNKADTSDLKVFIHLSAYGANQLGHIDLAFNNTIYSYGNYDKFSRKFFSIIGDGVMFTTNKVDEYIDFCLNGNKETVVEYGIDINNKQKEKLQKELDKIMQDSYEWKPPCRTSKKIKKLYYADKIYKSTKAKFYKFKSGKFKTFFIVGINCTYFIDLLLKKSVFEVLKLVGIISPGTYYEYLEENYKKKNSKVLYKKIYSKDSDVYDKNKK